MGLVPHPMPRVPKGATRAERLEMYRAYCEELIRSVPHRQAIRLREKMEAAYRREAEAIVHEVEA